MSRQEKEKMSFHGLSTSTSAPAWVCYPINDANIVNYTSTYSVYSFPIILIAPMCSAFPSATKSSTSRCRST